MILKNEKNKKKNISRSDDMIDELLEKIYWKLSKHQRKIVKKYYRGLIWLPRNLFIFSVRSFMYKEKIDDINLFEQRIYSQNGEDGILKIIFEKIGVTNKFCVEFGVQDGTECNTRYLIEKNGWNFLHMDCGDDLPVLIKHEIVDAGNINFLLEKYKVPKEFDLLSIDIDFNDYWIWKAIDRYSPRVVIIEYNASIPPTDSKTVEYDQNVFWDGTNYYGASLLALVKLGKRKGYTLIVCENRGVNAFFVRNDLIKNNFAIKSIEELYKPPRYGKKVNGTYIGWPPSDKLMIDV
jgi:hypothetical protein